MSVKIPYLFEVFRIKKSLFTMIPNHSGIVKGVELAACAQNDKLGTEREDSNCWFP